MATNKVITVTIIPTRTGDTVASYNAYSSVDGLLGSLSVAEAAAGKTFSLSDANHNITVKTVWTTAGESTTNVSNVVVVDLSTVAYKLVTSGVTDNDSLAWDVAERITMPLSGNWIFEVKGKSLLATNVERYIYFGSPNNSLRINSDGSMKVRESSGGFISEWGSSQADLGATTTLGAFNDGLQHTYKLSWTVGDSGYKLSIDGTDFGVGGTTNTTPTDDTIPFYLGYSSTKEPWEFEWLKITVGATLYEYKFNEGSGLVAEYEGGTDHTIDLTTDNATGQEARMWQLV